MSTANLSRPPLSLSAWLRYDAVSRLFPSEVARVLEIGAGLGSFGARLANRFDYVGLEPDLRSCEVASERVGHRGEIVNKSAEAYVASEPFDLVCAFEVLEHVDDDEAVLSGWLRHLLSGGYVLLSVPFDRDRFGAWDQRAGHYRRYNRADIASTMESVGLGSIETIVYGFPLGRAMEAARNVVARIDHSDRTMEARTASSARQIQPPAWASTATRLTSAPFRIAQRPFPNSRRGTGIVALGKL